MNVIGHENVMANPPAVTFRRTFRRLCVHVVKNTIGLSRNEETCGKCRCSVMLTSVPRPEGRPSPYRTTPPPQFPSAAASFP
jgi:hypothetical protein